MNRRVFSILPRRLDHQLVALFAVLFAMSIGIFGKFTGNEQYRSTLRIIQEHALRWSLEVANEAGPNIESGMPKALRSTLTSILRNSEATRFAIFDAEEKMLFAMRRTIDGRIVEETRLHGLKLPSAPIADSVLVEPGPLDPKTIISWAPVMRGGHLVGWVFGEFDTRNADEVRDQIMADSLLVGVMMIATATLLVYVFLRDPMRAVRRARDFAAALDSNFGAEADFSDAPTEIWKLGHALNNASKRLQRQHAALQDADRRKTVIVENALDAIVAIDHSGCVAEFNPSAELLFGYPRHMVIGRPATEFIAQAAMDDDVARSFGEYLEMADVSVRTELAGRRRNGERFVAEVAFASIISNGERTFIAYLRDITVRQQAEVALADQLEFVRQLLDAIPTAVYVKDAEGRYLSLNRAWCAFMGIEAETALGRKVRDLFSPEVAALHEKKDDELLDSGTQSYLTAQRRADGQVRDLMVSKARFLRRDGSIAGLIGVLTDITEQKQAEQAMRAARDAAEDANRAKSEFLANMSHEIRTPMNAILGLTEVVLDGELESETREHLKLVKEAADSLLGIINEILDFSKIEAGRLDFESIPFSLRDAVGLAVRTLAQRAAEKGLEINFHVDRATPDAYRGDPHRLRQVLTNLIGNALKFTTRGEIEVSARLEGDAGDTATVHFEVRDTGIGIPADKQRLVFEAFEQADTSTTRQFGGTGLGLAICRRLVEAMQGEIWVESTVGVGSTFHFTARLAPIAQTPVTLSMADLEGRVALVVEGHATGRRVLAGMLEGWGMRVLCADSARLALTSLGEASPPVTLAIVGGSLPDSEPFDLVNALRRRGDAALRVMLLMSAGMRGDAQRCRDAGVAAYLIKPVAESELLDALLIALDMPPDPAESPVTRHTVRERHRGLKLLLAEDNAVNQRLAMRLLEKLGHVVSVVGNGAEAVAAASAGEFDAVLMDLQMPVLGGFEATARIRAAEAGTGRRTPIIAMTAHAMDGDRERCLAAGMDAYVAKPIQLPMLAAALDSFEPASGGSRVEREFADDGPLLARADVLRNLDGDEALFSQLLSMLREELPGQRAQLLAAGEAGDPDRLRRVAHAIKGSVTNFGAAPLVSALQAIESAAAAGNAVDASRALLLLDRLANEIEV